MVRADLRQGPVLRLRRKAFRSGISLAALGFDSIVIPATADGGYTGEIAAGVFDFLGPTARDNVAAAMSAGRLTPTTPVRALLDSAAVRPRGPTSIIIATAADPDFTVQDAGRAAIELKSFGWASLALHG